MIDSNSPNSNPWEATCFSDQPDRLSLLVKRTNVAFVVLEDLQKRLADVLRPEPPEKDPGARVTGSNQSPAAKLLDEAISNIERLIEKIASLTGRVDL